MIIRPASKSAYKLFHNSSIALAQVEANGIRIDTKYLDGAIAKTEKRIKQLLKEMKDDPFYVKYRRDLGQKPTREKIAKLLFEKLDYESPEKSEVSGKHKTDESVFARIDIPFVKMFTEWKRQERTLSTYLKGIQKHVQEGYLHPSYNLNTARSFRGSCSDPNFQNIPIRIEAIGRLIRKAFIPRDGCILVENDFGGIEVCISACYNEDPKLIDYIEDDTKDMHRDMAAQCFKCQPEDVSKKMRYCGKNMFVFPQFYGDWFMDCARAMWEVIENQDLEVGIIPLKDWLADKGIRELGTLEDKDRRGTFVNHIKEVEQDFWGRRFKVYAKWKKRWYDAYLKNGYFKLKTGFVVHGIMSKNQVINTPVQGAAFHCLLWCLIEIQKELKQRRMKARIVGQIHDSILADVPVNEVDEYLSIVKEVTTERLPEAWRWIIVPMKIEAEITPENGTWHDKKEIAI